MTEGSVEDGNFLVRVRAQVMTRDDSTGGWVPMGGGGLSNVSVRKKILSTSSISDGSCKPEYLICGKRISDQTKIITYGSNSKILGPTPASSTSDAMVLSCAIKKDFQYNKVMPTFHHWKTGDKKFGLTFQTAADARAFDKGVRNAVEDLLDGAGCLNNFNGADVGDDDVFMTLELPVDSRSSSGSSSESGNGIGEYRPSSATPSGPGDSATSSPYSHPNAGQHHLHRMHFMRPSRTMPGVSTSEGGTSGLSASVSAGPAELQKLQAEDIWVKEGDSGEQQSVIDNDKIEPLPPGEPYSYVHFAKGRSSRSEHEYCYPTIETMKAGPQEGSVVVKKPHQMSSIGSEPPLLPSKKKKSSKKESRRVSPSGRVHCRHCLDTFSEDDNPPGSCEYAPDKMLACINAATCISCAQCMLYHCMSDAEGDFNHHPCSCDASDDHCHRRWTGLTLLSLFVPCLCCYLPLRACHRCGVNCGIWGGKHEPP